MKKKYLGVALVPACLLLAGSCVLDDREVQLVAKDGALPTEGGGTRPGDGEGTSGNALLSVGPEAIDLGRVTTGFSARARIRVENAGSASLPVPAVSFAQGSHADFSLIQNECSKTLAPGQACELRVQLVPSDSGPRTATLEVSSGAGGSASVALSALGLPAGDLILAPVAGSSEDFGGARVGATLEGAFSISAPSDVASGPLTFFVNRPEFQVLAPAEGDCVPETTSLVAGQTCSLRVAFTPSERGPVEATLTGASEAAGAVSVTLSGRGLLPAVLSTAAPTIDFDGVVVLSSAQRSIRFQNAGDEPLTLAGARLVPEGAEGFSILSSDCGAGTSLEGGAACLVQLEFRPPRVGEEMTAELVVAGTEPGQSQSIGVRGMGLEQGALLVTAQTPGDADFGEVLLGESSEHTFQIQNPSAQQSGGLELRVSEGFELATPPAEGECVPGSTSLVNGESCRVRVKFAPSDRESFSGSLTVSSPLAGARDLPLFGRGVLPASLLVEQEVNFGRVLTGATGQRTLSIENAGDQPLPPPTFELTSSSPTQVAAFSFESHCTAPIAFGERCDVALTFAPTAAAAHAVTLEVDAAGSSASVLLLGQAQLPGSLVLDPAAGSSTDFGDVPVGSNVTRSFTLKNPGQVPAGRLTISSDNNRFEPSLGDCNQGDPAGLVDGASCTFSVRFTPNDNLPQAANLSVQSPGAGRGGRQISGRGRLPAALSSDNGNRDLGRAYIGQASLSQPQNEFGWTINNQGDLPTGTLTLRNDDGTEFAIRNDSCSNSSIAARSSCQMIIRFVPSVAGNRTGSVVVNDPTSGRSVTLALTGLGVQLADLGESCANADCAQGTCTRGVCCDVACDRTCQVCSAGRCINQTNHEACGNSAACFGVDNCKLPEGRACSANGGDAQCGSGNCEQRLGGTGTGDRICCLDDCGNGLQCNAQNRCQAPALGSGAACGAAGQPACGAGLTCKPCLGGGNRCTPPGECCGGCAGNTPACDTQAGVCRQCVQAADCPVGATGTFRSCTNFACTYACSTQQGFRDCNGSCIASDQCCPQCPAGSTCINGTTCSECTTGQRRCNNGRPQQCNGGLFQDATPCAGNLTCVNGGQCGCSGNTPKACGNTLCVGQTDCCQNTDCTNGCQACNTTSHACGPLGGQPDHCPGNQACNVNGQCGGAGASCLANNDCSGGLCAGWALSGDGDAFGRQNTLVRTCGATPPQVPSSAGPTDVYVRVTEGIPDIQRFDCCDTDGEAHPGQTTFFQRARTGCGTGTLAFDFDCNGTIEANPPLAACTSFGIANCPDLQSSELNCGGNAAGGFCRAVDTQLAICTSGADCTCQGVRGALSPQTCR